MRISVVAALAAVATFAAACATLLACGGRSELDDYARALDASTRAIGTGTAANGTGTGTAANGTGTGTATTGTGTGTATTSGTRATGTDDSTSTSSWIVTATSTATDTDDCAPVLASQYDQSCSDDSDCVLVSEFDGCPNEACGCPSQAVNVSVAMAYETAVNDAFAEHPSSVACSCPCEGGAICRSGKCQAAYCSPPDSDTFAACRAVGGLCEFAATTTCPFGGLLGGCAYVDEVCCAGPHDAGSPEDAGYPPSPDGGICPAGMNLCFGCSNSFCADTCPPPPPCPPPYVPPNDCPTQSEVCFCYGAVHCSCTSECGPNASDAGWCSKYYGPVSADEADAASAAPCNGECVEVLELDAAANGEIPLGYGCQASASQDAGACPAGGCAPDGG